ncbi:MAG TPA: hypothetical protein VFM63_13600, partial [Pyrinomonadaceae bacterium]|nr:hypothetical protein [Pyrinomonadaceae bacterium]
LTGRYTAPGSGTIKLKGKMAGSDFTREIPVTLPETMALHDVLAPMWARARIDDLMSEDYMGAQLGRMRMDLKSTITQLAMEFRLMTQFTSFVAVEEITVTDNGIPRRIDVPVAVPAGVDFSRVMGGGGGGGPTGLFTLYSGPNQLAPQLQYSMQAQIQAQAQAQASAITKSGANKASAVGAGTGSANNSGGNPQDFALRPSGSLQPTRSPQEEKNIRIVMKLQPSLIGVVYRVMQKQDPHAFPFVRNGRVEVQLWLNDKSDLVKAKLKELGFETVLDHADSNLMIGRIPVDKLELLVDFEFVRYVSPLTTR